MTAVSTGTFLRDKLASRSVNQHIQLPIRKNGLSNKSKEQRPSPNVSPFVLCVGEEESRAYLRLYRPSPKLLEQEQERRLERRSGGRFG